MGYAGYQDSIFYIFIRGMSVAIPADIQIFLDDMVQVLGVPTVNRTVLDGGLLNIIIDNSNIKEFFIWGPSLPKFTLGDKEVLNSATGATATVMGAVGKGLYGSVFKVQYKGGMEQVVKRIVCSSDSELIAILPEVMMQTYLYKKDPIHVAQCQSLRVDPTPNKEGIYNTYYIGMAPLEKTLFQHIADKAYEIRAELTSGVDIDPKTIFHDQYLLNIVGPVYHVLNTLSPNMLFHGDLHVGNIMYREGGFPHEPVLIDFGRAMCRFSNSYVGPFQRGISSDLLTLCSALQQFFLKISIKIPLLTTLLEPAMGLLISDGQFQWHNLGKGFLPNSIIEPFSVTKFRGYAESKTDATFPEPVASTFGSAAAGSAAATALPDPSSMTVSAYIPIDVNDDYHSPPPVFIPGGYSSYSSSLSSAAATLTTKEEEFVNSLFSRRTTRRRRNRRAKTRRVNNRRVKTRRN